MKSPTTLLLGLLLANPQGDADPRLQLMEERLADRPHQALRLSREIANSEPELDRELWLGYQRGDLFERLGRLEQANAEFARLLNAEPPLLAAHSRIRMAALQELMGHPEVAAGLLANLLGRGAPETLVPWATDMLARALDSGADCRLLGRLDAWPLGAEDRRPLDLAQARCALDAGETETASGLLVELLDQKTTDLIGRRAAESLAELETSATSLPEVQIAIGLAFHHNREFERAIVHLERGLSNLDPERLSLSPDALDDYRYAVARAYFWLRDYERAGTLFRELASAVDRNEMAARALYQAARCHELVGEWDQAAATFGESFLAQRDGDWSAAALFSALRIDFRRGREETALEVFQALESRPAWREIARRAALFLAASDIERGRSDRAGAWLRRPPGKYDIFEFLYWAGRLAELENRPERAIGAYLDIIARSAHHPLAVAARERLLGDDLAPSIEPLAQQLAASGRRQDLHAAWILLGDASPAGATARQQLVGSLEMDPRARVWLAIDRVDPRDWTLWNHEHHRFEDRMLALGLWREGEARLGRHFPFEAPSLALEASALLAQAGLNRKSLRIAEILADGAPRSLPETLWPTPLRRHLYPFHFRELIAREAGQHGVEPELLAGLVREESRFDPQAVSAAAARGLTQFVQPTATRIASSIGRPLEDPADLHDPEVSIALGAAYLAELLQAFDGRLEHAVTAYNAGEDQTRLWRSYCYSRNPAEYYSKVGFAETRGYLRKVLTSRAQYAELYPTGSPR